MRIIRLSRLLIIPVLAFLCMASRCNVRHAIRSDDRRDTSIYREIKFTLSELKINNGRFLKELDKIIFTDELGKLKDPDFKCFYIQVEQHDTVKLFVQFLRNVSPVNIGYFSHRDYIFTIAGDNPDSLFCKTKTDKEFSVWYPRSDLDLDSVSIPPPPPPESFPCWLLEYRDGRLFLEGKRVW